MKNSTVGMNLKHLFDAILSYELFLNELIVLNEFRG